VNLENCVVETGRVLLVGCLRVGVCTGVKCTGVKCIGGFVLVGYSTGGCTRVVFYV
jgi:hypothetical protein